MTPIRSLPPHILLAALAIAPLLVSSTFAADGDGNARSPATRPSDERFQSYRAHIAAAEALHRLGETGAAARWIDAAPTDQRGWEWHYLANLLDQSVHTFDAGGEAIFSIAVSPDMTVGATAGATPTIHLWDVATSEPLRTLEGDKGIIFHVGFSPDGAFLSSAHQDGKVILWNTATWERARVFEGHKNAATCSLFSRDSKTVYYSSYDRIADPPYIKGVVRAWSVETGEEVMEPMHGGRKPISQIALSPDGKLLAASSWDFSVFVWSTGTGELVHTLTPEREELYNAIDCVAFSPNGRWIAAGAKDELAHVWDAKSGEVVAMLRGHTGDVSSVAFGPDGDLLATGSGDATIVLWDTTTWTVRERLLGHHAAVRALVFPRAAGLMGLASPPRLLSGGSERGIKEWDASAGYGTMRLDHGGTLYTAPISPDGHRMATGGEGTHIRLWNLDVGEEIASWDAHDGTVVSIDFSPDGSRLASSSWDKTVRVRSLEMGAELARLEHDAGVAWVTFHPDGAHLATVAGKKVALWDLDTSSTVRTFPENERGFSMAAFAPDGSHLAAAAGDGTIAVWDTTTGDVAQSFKAHSARAKSLAFLPGGADLVTCGEDGRMKRWRLADGAELWSVNTGGENLSCLATSPDGTRIAAASIDGQLYDAATGAHLLSVSPSRESLYFVGWSGDGSRLVFSAMDGMTFLPTTRPMGERIAATRIASRIKDQEIWIEFTTSENGGPSRAWADTIRSDDRLDDDERLAIFNTILRRELGRVKK